jgi:hypothetical protein
MISVSSKVKEHNLKKTVIIFLFLFMGCSSPNKSDELLFLENVMLREDGLYVLMGSKPMSTFWIEDSGYPETEEEAKVAYNLYLSEIKAGNIQESPISYGEFSRDCLTSVHLHTKRLWDSTKNQLKDYVGPFYRFVEMKSSFGKQARWGLFINIPSTLMTLKHHYQEFVEIYGEAFDPEMVINEISNQGSPFWTLMFASNLAQGLLFGYGSQNAHTFEWQLNHNILLPYLDIEGQHLVPLMKKQITVKDLSLPRFRVYSVTDRRLDEYKREQKLIQKEFHGKNFEKTVKECLSKGSRN